MVIGRKLTVSEWERVQRSSGKTQYSNAPAAILGQAVEIFDWPRLIALTLGHLRRRNHHLFVDPQTLLEDVLAKHEPDRLAYFRRRLEKAYQDAERIKETA
jgi:hypothetical protein